MEEKEVEIGFTISVPEKNKKRILKFVRKAKYIIFLQNDGESETITFDDFEDEEEVLIDLPEKPELKAETKIDYID